MLTKIQLINVKLHKNLTLNLAPNINIVVGHTETGKTGMLKGLLWALKNWSTGEKLINNQGAKSCKVLLEVDGHTVVREWSKSLNSYTLDGTPFCSFRTDVPAQIADIINIDNVNIQTRRDLPFMVYWKASESADQFSQMMDISEINTSIRVCNKMVVDSKQETATLKSLLDAACEEFKNYSGVDEAFDGLNKLISLEKQCLAVEAELSVLQKMLNTYIQEHESTVKLSAVEPAIEHLERITKTTSEVNTLVQWIKEASSIVEQERLYSLELSAYSKAFEALDALSVISNKESELRTHASSVHTLTTKLSDYLKIKEEVVRLSVVCEALDGLAAVKQSTERTNKAADELSRLLAFSDALKEAEDSVSMCNNNLIAAQNRFKAEMPDECPLCGSNIKECKDEVLSIG